MHAVVLAGGQGARLQPHTIDIPKALVPLGGKPIVEILLHRLRRAGVQTVHMAVNHRAEQIKAAIGNGDAMGLDIRYSVEDKPLSTVGPLRLIDNLPSQFVVVNADVLTDLDFNELYQFHSRHDAPLTVATYRRKELIDYGVLESDAGGLVTEFSEKPNYSFSVSMGVYLFSRDLLKVIPSGVPYGFDHLMRDMLARNEKVATYAYEGYWMDIGRPPDYEQAQRDIRENPGLGA